MQYPSIAGSKSAPLGEHCVAYHKYDGSNLRWEWNPKRGWCKYGTRTQLFEANTPLYNQAIQQFQDEIGPVVVDQVKSRRSLHKIERITAFTEFFGPSSFAGSHDETEPKELKLLDVFLFKVGFLSGREFAELFNGHSWSPEVIYKGKLTSQFIQDVRAGRYPVVEGVVCKGDGFMVKIKTYQYLEKLKAVFSNKWEQFAE